MHRNLASLSLLPWLMGCAGLERPIGDAALGGAGAYLGHHLSGGSPTVAAAGAVGGVVLGEGLHAWKSSATKKAYAEGYTQGRANGVKQLYWSLQEQQRGVPAAQSSRLYDVTIPEHWEDGVFVKPTQRMIRIQE